MINDMITGFIVCLYLVINLVYLNQAKDKFKPTLVKYIIWSLFGTTIIVLRIIYLILKEVLEDYQL